jgi:hypothetical protein
VLRGAPPAPTPTPTPTPTPAPDRTPPAVSLTAPASGASTDGLPTFSGSTEPGAQVTVRLALTGGAVRTFGAGVAGDGGWSVRAPELLAPGAYTVQAAARDAAGNEATSPTVSLTVVPTVAAAGDIACLPGRAVTATQCQQQATSDLLVGAGYHNVLALGDNQYDVGTLSNYLGSYDPTWGRVRAITRPVAGNHEYSATNPPSSTATADGYWDYFNGPGVNNGPAGPRGQGWYSFDLGAWHLIALNSDCAQVAVSPQTDGCAADSPQAVWLKADLAASTASCTLVYWHHPRFSSGNGHDDPEMQPIWQDVADAHADLVLNGHSHGYEEFKPMDGSHVVDAAGVQEIVVGTGGEDFFPLTGSTLGASSVKIPNTFGVLRLSLRPADYDWKFISIAGTTLSSGTRSCH